MEIRNLSHLYVSLMAADVKATLSMVYGRHDYLRLPPLYSIISPHDAHDNIRASFLDLKSVHLSHYIILQRMPPIFFFYIN